ncbi:TPA: ABC transporter transmembrane domain-containing protein, partial [Clostridium perfringens]
MKNLYVEEFKILKRSFKYLKPHIITIFFLLIITFSVIFFEMVQPLLMGNIIDKISLYDFKSIKNIILIIFIISVFNILFNYKENLLLAKISNEIEFSVKNDIFNSFLNITYSNYRNLKKGELLEKIEQDSKVFSTLLLQCIISILSDFFNIIVIGYIIFRINTKLSLILIVIFPISLYIYKIYGEKIKKINFKYKSSKDFYLSYINEILSGFKLVKIFKSEKFFLKKYKSESRKIIDLKINAAKKYAEGDLFNGAL